MKAGRLLSKFIRQIAEETEFVKGENPSEDDRMVAKAELLARSLWRQALGWEELIVTEDGAAKKVIHLPDAKIAFLLMDRMEGRAPTAVDDSDDRPSTAMKVTEQGLKRINAAGRIKDA
jgi:hypothetical protein